MQIQLRRDVTAQIPDEPTVLHAQVMSWIGAEYPDAGAVIPTLAAYLESVSDCPAWGDLLSTFTGGRQDRHKIMAVRIAYLQRLPLKSASVACNKILEQIQKGELQESEEGN